MARQSERTMERLRWRLLVEWLWPADANAVLAPDPPHLDGAHKIAAQKARQAIRDIQRALFTED